MGRLFAVSTAFVLSVSSISASAQLSPSAQVKEPVLRASQSRFNHAVALLDGYRGDTASLEAARAELEGVLKDNSRSAPAHREMARYFIMRGQINSSRFQPGSLEAADLSIKKALEINPNFAEAFVLQGHLYRLMKRHNEAVTALKRAEALGATDPWLQNNWADLLIDEGKFEEAAQRYRKVIDSKTPNKKAMVSAFDGLIRYYRSVGKLDQADEIYKKRIEFEPNAAWGYGNYAQFLLCQRDDYDASIKRSREALRVMDYGVARYWLAAALYRRWAQGVISGTPESGVQYFTEAQSLHSNPDELAARAESCPPLRFITEARARSGGPGNSAPSGASSTKRI